MKTRTTVFCTARTVGFHSWPEAYDEVAYLRAPHRHEFHFRAECVVDHDERQVEFHTLRRALEQCLDEWRKRAAADYGPTEIDFGTNSCEAIARLTMSWLKAEDFAVTAVEVSEDGENGARVEEDF